MLMTELYKIKNELDSPIRDSMLNRRTVTHNFNNLQEFQSKKKENCSLWSRNVNPIQGGGKKTPPTSFPLVTSTNVTS